ncbi:hypothetical protein DUNSADRAFT_9496 [Dunaliella salina]|uniref:Uncharacterized protein n=1 Tax=Dunaliella salina TaxID=3046 RepID=A0ABQ7GHC3_DUNSA|nr:hypothetical protein DUNSADRAFT_9496 [Dunaliella salina]|eukprot:KAF5834011.1 hypothetical protein DUNSADRAFT_9496 [Dunaliella salina]
MEQLPPQETAIVLHLDTDRLSQSVDSSKFPGVPELLLRYADLTRATLERLCGLRDFSHVVFKEESTSYKQGEAISLPFCIVVGPPRTNPDSGELEGVTQAKIVYDIMGALTARGPLPGVFAGKMGWAKGDPNLRLTDEGAHAIVDRFTKRLRLGRELDNVLPEEELTTFAEALSSMVPPTARTQPVQPDDLLMVLPLFVAEAAGVKAGPLRRAVRSVRGALGGVQGVVWRAEDFAKAVAKFSVKASLKLARPALIGFVVYRTLGTIGNSRTLENRMQRLPHGEALDLYCREMLGKDYGKQVGRSDDYKDEKRRITAAMLRRLEVEEWDKERMKHFYYGSHGLGPWYFDMEERLRNPYFLGSRGWNGPIESWVGKNKTFHKDLRREDVDFTAAAMRLVEGDKGVPLTEEQKARIIFQEQMPAVDSLLGKNSILDGIVSPDAIATIRRQ